MFIVVVRVGVFFIQKAKYSCAQIVVNVFLNLVLKPLGMSKTIAKAISWQVRVSERRVWSVGWGGSVHYAQNIAFLCCCCTPIGSLKTGILLFCTINFEIKNFSAHVLTECFSQFNRLNQPIYAFAEP